MNIPNLDLKHLQQNKHLLLRNLAVLTDSYKVSQWPMYKPGTQYLYSYMESRGGVFPSTVWFGAQYPLKEVLSTTVTKEMVEIADVFWAQHFGRFGVFNKEGWMTIVNKHNGKIPVIIRQAPEGSVIPTSNLLLDIINTDPDECAWITQWVETILMQNWHATTVATKAHYMRKLVLEFLNKNGTPALIDYKVHDFGMRGSTGIESSGIAGLAHCLSSRGSDTSTALIFGMLYYNAQPEEVANSIPAGEHSNITSWGRDNEEEVYRHIIKHFGPDTAVFAFPIDSYDAYYATAHILGTKLKGEIMNIKGTLVFRPDSGTPHEVAPKIVEILGDKFGFSYNEKGAGYKVLNSKVRVIQGDGVDIEEVRKILTVMDRDGWSSDNIAFGWGGALHMKCDRDTQKFAIKCSHALINKVEVDVYKSPVTDSGKRSKRGKLSLIRTAEGCYKTVKGGHPDDIMVEVFRNGEVVKEWNLSEVRATLRSHD